MTTDPLWLPEIPSTNDAAWIEGPARGADFLCVAADRQTAGRGRHGRTWHAPAGKDLLFSIFLHPARPLAPAGVVTALGAVAVCETLEKRFPDSRSVQREASSDSLRASRFAQVGLKIRWPNDLYVGEKKLCGILAESREIQGRPAYVVGIGLNANSLPEDWPPEIRGTATSVRTETGRETDRRALLAAILTRLETLYRDAARGDVAALETAWRERSDLAGRPARVETPGGIHEGEVLSAGLSEGIVIRTGDGRRLAFQPEHVTRVETIRPVIRGA